MLLSQLEQHQDSTQVCLKVNITNAFTML